MVWVRLDDAILDNPKIIRVGPIGFALHAAAMTFCGRNSTDGFIAEAKAKQLLSTTWATAEAADGKEQIWELAAVSKHAGFEGHEVIHEVIKLLVQVGLWHEDMDDRGNFGYRLHDYLEYNPSRAQVRGKSEKRAAAGRSGGKQSASKRQANAKQKRSKQQAAGEAKTNPEPEPEPKEIPLNPPKGGVRASRPKHVRSFEASFGAVDPEDEWAFQRWAKRFGKTGAVFDAKRASCLEDRRLEGMTREDVDDALAGAEADEWCKGTGYKLSVIFDDRERYETYRDAGRQLRTGASEAPARWVVGADGMVVPG